MGRLRMRGRPSLQPPPARPVFRKLQTMSISLNRPNSLCGLAALPRLARMLANHVYTQQQDTQPLAGWTWWTRTLIRWIFHGPLQPAAPLRMQQTPFRPVRRSQLRGWIRQVIYPLQKWGYIVIGWSLNMMICLHILGHVWPPQQIVVPKMALFEMQMPAACFVKQALGERFEGTPRRPLLGHAMRSHPPCPVENHPWSSGDTVGVKSLASDVSRGRAPVKHFVKWASLTEWTSLAGGLSEVDLTH